MAVRGGKGHSSFKAVIVRPTDHYAKEIMRHRRQWNPNLKLRKKIVPNIEFSMKWK